MAKYVKYILGLLLVILLDQGSKLWVYNHMEIGPENHIKLFGNFLKCTYVLNYGMAFGLQFGFKYGKLLITFVRIVASIYIGCHIIRSFYQSSPSIWIWGWILLLGGAIGNSIDSIFYGVYLNNAPVTAPMKWFHGQVIDMVHFDVYTGSIPDWVPFCAGQEFSIFPIFNIADVAIFIGLFFVFFGFNSSNSFKAISQVTRPIP